MAPLAATMARSCCGFRWLLLLPSLCCFLVSPVASSPVAVTHLPGFDGPLPFPLKPGTWSLEVDESKGVHFFYYFVPSEKDPARDPLVLWMQGGPGCSGLAYEMGPLRFDIEGYRGGLPTLLYRPETWTKTENLGKNRFLISRGTSLAIQFFHGMGLISDELYQTAEENCGGNYVDPHNALCDKSIQDIDDCTKNINSAHVLEPYCEKIWSPRIQQEAARNGTSGLMVEYSTGDDLQPVHFKWRSDTLELVYIWANDETVRKSLGVRKETRGEWIRCDRSGRYTPDITSTVETHLMLARKGYPALIYSGDHDSDFSFVGTHAWIRSLNLSITDDWRPWHVDGQVAGFTRSFSSNLTYATVKGAGHTAPEYKPKECLTMFTRWISGDPL